MFTELSRMAQIVNGICVVLCGVVGGGVVWSGVVWSGVVWCGVVYLNDYS